METDIRICLEKGEYVKRRASLMRNLEIPKLSDAVSALGPPLAQLVFDQCDEALKENFGLTPPLNGAGDELWVSPSDILIGKVVLKPPLTQKHVQALTHQGILSIGMDIEVKFWNEMEMEKERALAEQRKDMQDYFEDELNAQLKLVEMHERAACQQEMKRMTEAFEARLLGELDKLAARLKHEFAEVHKQQEIQFREEFARTLEKETERTVQNMTKEFLADLERQKNILSRNFKLGLMKVYKQKEYEQRIQNAKYKESIRQLKHNLECKNLANMMYVLCMEKRKCCEEKMGIEKHYETEIGLLFETILLKEKDIKDLVDEKNRLLMDVRLRETCLMEIITQFQKFINFALRASPTQAEFLLSVEKMMVFELTNAILNSHFRTVTPYTDILPWCNYAEKSSEMVDLQIMDYHDCLNEINPPLPPSGDLGPDDYLPAFHYGDKMYVREDFRNMCSQGIRITRSSTLWSKDVEILMDTLQQSVSSLHNEEEEEKGKPSARSSRTQAGESNILFKINQGRVPSEKMKIASSMKDELKSSIKLNLEDLDRVDFSKIGKVEDSPAILATTSSVEMMIQKASVKHLPSKKLLASIDKSSDYGDSKSDLQNLKKMIQVLVKRSEESVKILKRRTSLHTLESYRHKLEEGSIAESKPPAESKYISPKGSLVLGTKDSIILRRTSLARKSNEFNILPMDSIEIRKDSLNELKGKASRLVSTRNSVEMLRESKMKLKESLIKCQRKTSPKVMKSSSGCTDTKDVCNKCIKTKDESSEIINVLGQEEYKQGRNESIRVSGIEVYSADSIETNVTFNTVPTVYDSGSTAFSSDLFDVYKDEKACEIAQKKFVPPPKDKFLCQRPELKILGDPQAKEYLQTSDEFTIDRIKSFIALIKDNPKLIRTFTACTR